MNINEKFLLELLAHTKDFTTDQTEPDSFCFHPDDFNMEVKIPYDNGSDQVNIDLIYSMITKNGRSLKKTINFIFDSISEINEFLTELFKKYENYLNRNNSEISEQILDKFENILRLPIDEKYPYNSQINYEKPYIEDKGENEQYNMDIFDSIFTYSQKNKLKPLSPILIHCYYNSGEIGATYKKVIPAYLINEYPILNKHIKSEPVVSNIHELSNALNSLRLNNSKSQSILNALILEEELSNNNSEKKPKSKL